MFSGVGRWFEQHVVPLFSSWTKAAFTPLMHDVETAGGQALAAAVQKGIAQVSSGGPLDAGKMLQAGVEAGKTYLVANGIPDLEHAAVGLAAAMTAGQVAAASTRVTPAAAAVLGQAAP